MKNKVLNTIAVIFLTALIVVGGIFIPRLTLEHQRIELSSRSGAVEAKSLTPYGNDRKILTERLASLSSLLYDAGDIYINFYEIASEPDNSLIVSDSRDALSTELSAEDAYKTAAALFAELCSEFAGFGFPLSTTPPTDPTIPPAYYSSDKYSSGKYSSDKYSLDKYSSDKYSSDDYSLNDYSSDDYYDAELSESPASTGISYNSGIVLLTSADDPSLSMWQVTFDGSLIILDALSGLPLYIYLDAGYFPMYIDYSIPLWETAVQFFASLSEDQFSFPATPDKEYGGKYEYGASLIFDGASDLFTLSVTTFMTYDNYVLGYSFRIR